MIGTAAVGGPSDRVEGPDSTGAGTESSVWRELAAQSAATFGTPCYLSRWRPVHHQVVALERWFQIRVRSWLSFKTHPVPQLVRAWLGTGRGVEVTSQHEFAAVVAAGCPPDRLLVNGVAKHWWLRTNDTIGLRVHFDSVQEVEALLTTAARNRWRVGLRCHVPAEHDRREPGFGGQFGLSWHEVLAVATRCRSIGVEVEGLHFHLGQGARTASDYHRSIEYVVQLCRAAGIAPRYIDCGGGLREGAEADGTVGSVSSAIAGARQEFPTLEEVWLENGSYVTRESAALIVRVLDVKDRTECRYAICDGGRTNQALDADNGPHPIMILPDRDGPGVLTTLAGPTCMTDDRLGRLILPASVTQGDLIVWLNAGAYHLPWETRFSQGLCAVVWADENEAISLAREREAPAAWSQSWRM